MCNFTCAVLSDLYDYILERHANSYCLQAFPFSPVYEDNSVRFDVVCIATT